MTEQQAHQLLTQAERAATAGDLAAADELLRSAARIQEKELGPLHPDLANTLNNLAIIAEKTGSSSEAETLYRRAAAIAAAALPSDHPMVVASRQNLEDFCRARGLSIEAPAVITPTRDAVLEVAKAAPASHSRVWPAAAAVVLVAAVLLVWRPWSSRDASAPAPTPEPAAASAPIEQAAPPAAAPPRDGRSVATNKHAAAGGIMVATAQLCRTLSTSGSSWRCDPAGQSVAPGQLTFYTRVRSPRDTAVVHRWYQGDTLRQSVTLQVQANATEGYRTYSRLTVHDGHWRLEVRTADDRLLREEHFAVR